jgi:hypothetical protein
MPDATSELTLLADGFRRVGPPPPAREGGRLRALLAAAGSGPAGTARPVQDGVATLGSWHNASAFAALLPAGALGRTAAARRILRRALTFLGTPPTAVDALETVARGAPVRLIGRVQRPRWKLVSHIWSKSESSDHNVRLLVEEGHDFFLQVASWPGGLAVVEVLVLAAGGWLAGGAGTALHAGDPVEVWGFADRVIDQAARSSSRHPRGEPLALALRAGDDLPLVVHKIAPRPPHARGEPGRRS